MKLPPFYTARFVEVRSKSLSAAWLLIGLAMVLGQITAMVGNYGFVQRVVPNVDVGFWQDVATDGSNEYWPVGLVGDKEPQYCRNSTTYFYDASREWGSDPVRCIDPGTTAGKYVYPSSDELLIASSVARAAPGQDPQWQSSQVCTYIRQCTHTSKCTCRPVHVTFILSLSLCLCLCLSLSLLSLIHI